MTNLLDRQRSELNPIARVALGRAGPEGELDLAGRREREIEFQWPARAAVGLVVVRIEVARREYALLRPGLERKQRDLDAVRVLVVQAPRIRRHFQRRAQGMRARRQGEDQPGGRMCAVQEFAT